MWRAVDDLLLRSISEGAFPGCAMAAGQGGRVLFTSVHGRLAHGSPKEVTHTTRYDVGALTQVMSTVPLVLHALENGLISLDDPIALWLDNVPEDKREITILNLLTQTSGITPHFLLPDEAQHSRDALSAILRHPLAGSIGGKVRDSAMGYILLGLVLDRVFQMPLGFVTQSESAWKLCEILIREAVAMAAADGVEFDVEDKIEEVRRVSVNGPMGITSICADLQNGRMTEVDTISGSVVRAAKRLGMQAPHHEMMVLLIHAFEDKNRINKQ